MYPSHSYLDITKEGEFFLQIKNLFLHNCCPTMEWAAEEKSPLPIRGGVQAKAKQLLDEAAEEKA